MAQPYPKGLCCLLAISLCQGAGWCRTERLNVSECSKTGSLRAGEAKNPGPRVRRVPVRHEPLSTVQLLTPQTLALDARQLSAFLGWCAQFFPDEDVQALFGTVPQFLRWALKAYADMLYRTGGALSNCRHLILAVQRWVPTSRLYMVPAWEMVERDGSQP